jgi:hypothetical protein
MWGKLADFEVFSMASQNLANSLVDKQKHDHGLKMAHLALQHRLLSPMWSVDDFYSAMAVYRKEAGIEFRSDDDAMLDKWLSGAEAAWKQEVNAKGDKISLAEVLERGIQGGIKAIGLRLATKTPAEGFKESNARTGVPGGTSQGRALASRVECAGN